MASLRIENLLRPYRVPLPLGLVGLVSPVSTFYVGSLKALDDGPGEIKSMRTEPSTYEGALHRPPTKD